MNLVYCPRCNKLYAKTIREMCNNCYNELEKDYERCVQYLRENKGLNIQQLSDDTEISIKQITRWIREGRISLLNAPNLSYPCETCGTLIRDGHMCDSCKARLQRDVRNANSTGLQQHNPDENKHSGAYQIGNRLKDRQ
ncbi:flagellar protein [Cohnella silvisoli]|uniref:Flagellar protein n=1 Tax=Cohnella silvisoli TaxID=2873699 RepID=A0ABV1KPN7_9BACL|nr:flagellar protein [Cohnella silvisoli]MCD9022301.1 flagellar protein [Cohnella silvisoli]